MKHFFIPLLSLLSFHALTAEKTPIPTAYTTQQIEGWNVRIDNRLLKGESAPIGDRALKLLNARLVAITVVVPEKALAKLRAITVHIPVAEDFLSPFENHRMPWVVLHELAHGYHDQVLGFDDPRVKAAWKKFRDSGKYQSVLTSPGYTREHYGITNPQEFFAEMTESYFGSNDFYPFVTGELKQAEPEIFALMEDIWGPLPGRAPRKNPAQPKSSTPNSPPATPPATTQ
ncbi:MAG: hypothetical protein NTX04_12975 [Verrucomicrobia bacterium]|nr:hypothetical protein [Verrucomicrobiota bacterium]